MTIYAAFNEGEALSGTNFGDSSSITAVSGVSRSGFKSIGSVGGITADLTLDTPFSEGFFHCLTRTGRDPTITAGDILIFRDSSDTKLFSLSVSNDGDQVNFESANGSGQTNIFQDNQLKTVDIHFKISDSTDGFIFVYVDEELVYQENGVTNASTSDLQLASIRWRTPSSFNSLDLDTDRFHYGQVILSDENTLGARLYTLTPTAGSINTWDVGTVTDVDEQDVDDTDFASTTTNGDQFTIDTSDTLSTTSNYFYTAVVQSFRASYDSGSSVTKITPFLNDTTVTDLNAGTAVNLTTGYAPYQYIWDNNPATTSEWTAGEINDYEFGVEATT